MVTIGLITEGITDQIVIENILIGYFKQPEDEIEFNELQPLRDDTDENKVQNYGGWDKASVGCISEASYTNRIISDKKHEGMVFGA